MSFIKKLMLLALLPVIIGVAIIVTGTIMNSSLKGYFMEDCNITYTQEQCDEIWIVVEKNAALKVKYTELEELEEELEFELEWLNDGGEDDGKYEELSEKYKEMTKEYEKMAKEYEKISEESNEKNNLQRLGSQ